MYGDAVLVGITALAATLDARQQARFTRLCTGLLFARGRRTVTSWLRGCGAGRDYQRERKHPDEIASSLHRQRSHGYRRPPCRKFCKFNSYR